MARATTSTVISNAQAALYLSCLSGLRYRSAVVVVQSHACGPVTWLMCIWPHGDGLRAVGYQNEPMHSNIIKCFIEAV
jgi:hypothetical protein